jgi:plastocyanin
MRRRLMSGTLGTAGVVLFAACGGSTSPYGGGGGGASCTPTATQVCTAAGFSEAFNPVNLTVPVGTTVTWNNGSAQAHTVTSATGSGDVYNSGNMNAAATYQHTFMTAGTYPYYCQFHGVNGTPPTGMHGTITVQ